MYHFLNEPLKSNTFWALLLATWVDHGTLRWKETIEISFDRPGPNFPLFSEKYILELPLGKGAYPTSYEMIDSFIMKGE